MNINPLRQKVVDYMKKMATIEWVPEDDFVTFNPGVNGDTTMLCVFRKGETYFGPPYINGNMCQAETFNLKRVGAYKPFNGTQEQLDSIVNSATIKEIGGEILETAIENAYTFPGNDCMGSVQLAWNSAINNGKIPQELQFCHNTIPFEGRYIQRVGEYTCNPELGNNTDLMCEENGEQVMARAYAKLLPGDAVTHVKSLKGNGRHIRLVIGYPYVEYMKDENGNTIINMERSYVKLLDQAGGAIRRYIKGNIKASMQEHEFTFKELFNLADIPVTIPELISGDNGVEENVIENLDLSKLATEKKISGVISSNRQIIYVKAEISDTYTVHTVKDIIRMANKGKRNYHCPEYDLANLEIACPNFKEGVTYTFNLFVCTSGNDGKEINLVRDYKFSI